MRTLKTFAAAAALLLVAGSANAAIIVTITENLADPTADLDLQMDIELIGVSGGGLGSFGGDLLQNGVISNIVGNNFSSLQFFGNQPDGTNIGWGDFGNGPTDGFFAGILTFTLTGATGIVDLGGPNLYASDDSFANITGTITVNPYVIPEPTTAALLGLGLFGLALGGRRR